VWPTGRVLHRCSLQLGGRERLAAVVQHVGELHVACMHSARRHLGAERGFGHVHVAGGFVAGHGDLVMQVACMRTMRMCASACLAHDRELCVCR
jgi:hypothetical protein